MLLLLGGVDTRMYGSLSHWLPQQFHGPPRLPQTPRPLSLLLPTLRCRGQHQKQATALLRVLRSLIVDTSTFVRPACCAEAHWQTYRQDLTLRAIKLQRVHK